MVNGVAVLQEVDGHLAEAQRQASAAQTEADRLAARREGLRTEEAEALRELARLRLLDLADGRVALDALDAAGAQLRESLARRAGELDAVQRAVLDACDGLAAAEATRDAAAARHTAAQEAEAAALKAADAQAAQDADFQRIAATAEEAERIAQHAEQKSGFAARDFEEKGRPYRADPLFAYLWDRGWGTGRYRAFPLVRLIDGWVARLIAFEPARRSYALLAELPGSMTSHAARMRANADAAVRAMVERRRALAGLPADAARGNTGALDAAEDAVEAARAVLAEAEAKRSTLAAGDDPASQQAIRALEAALGARSLRTLRAEAARTPTREDDAIVSRLEVAAAERARLERALADAQAQAEGARRRLDDLQSLRHDMRGRGVERSDWGFASGALVGGLVTELLRGTLSRDGFWDRMERQRMPDQMPGTSQPGPWGRPLPGPWERQAPGPWSTKPGPSDSGSGGWWDDGGSSNWGKGQGQGGGQKGGGFTTGGSSDSGGGFRTGGSV